jgi:competence protein ComEC
VLACATWVGSLAGLAGPVWVILPVAAAVIARRPVLVLALAVSCAAGTVAAARAQATRDAAIPDGSVAIAGVASADPMQAGDGVRFPILPSSLEGSAGWVEWRGPRLLVVAPEAGVVAGDHVLVRGFLASGSTTFRGDPVAGVLRARSVDPWAGPRDPFGVLGNRIRARVRDGLAPWWPRSGAILVAGFLTGDVAELPDVDAEALRRAGLSHFVAVSGSNVALFLLGLFVVLGPFAWGPRRRAAAGLLGLGVFVVATRWEPSVVRAATMAGLVLAGRLAGFALDAWTALGVAVTGVLLVSPELAADLGFQLSAAATAGVLAGAHVFAGRRPRWLWTAAGASLAAQAAVSPILLGRLGSVPSAGPITNPVAAPIVAAATVLGGIGTMLGIPVLTGLAASIADRVLDVARVAAPLPELDARGVAAVALVSLATLLLPVVRPLVVAVAVGVVGASLIPPGPPPGPEMVVLDVGQGDAILLRGPSGEAVLVDGGPDPVVLAAALRRRGIRRVDLLVATHRHADHTTGLAGVTADLEVRRFWHPGAPGEDEPLDRLVADLTERSVDVRVPRLGTRLTVGSFEIEVLGPRRRYASPNDGSIVLLVRAAGRSALLAGDVETYAQADLGPVRADVLKVPHQGAATTDLDWLRASAGRVAVVSVGPNDFGHPSPEVIATLEAAGATVYRTDRDGDVVLRFDRLPTPLPSAP